MMADPFLVLGVPRNANDATVRSAYLAAVREHPPDRDPERFRSIREAYDAIADRRDRARVRLFGAARAKGAPSHIEDVLGEVRPARRYPGSGPWLEVVRRAAPPDEEVKT